MTSRSTIACVAEQGLGDAVPARAFVLVSGYENLYVVSDVGRVISVRSGRELAQIVNRYGYLTVGLCKNGQRKSFYVHRLVCRAFNGEPNALHCEVAHLDGNKNNNVASNLKWASKGENAAHRRLHGTHPAGSNHPRAKLTENDVRVIRKREGSSRELAAKFRVSRHTIFDIWEGRKWRSLASVPASIAIAAFCVLYFGGQLVRWWAS